MTVFYRSITVAALGMNRQLMNDYLDYLFSVVPIFS
jgi:uncharacterized membrane protein YpjA